MKRTSFVLIGVGGALVGYGAYKLLSGPPAPGLAASAGALRQLDPTVAALARRLIQRAYRGGISIAVASAYRDPAEQARLYAQGRSAPGPIVTNAPAGSSWHEFRRAFDVALLDAGGKLRWPEDDALWRQIGAFGKSIGLLWGGDFTSIKDRPHFEHHPGLTLSQARATLIA